MADYQNCTHSDYNEDLRLPLHIYQCHKYYESLRYQPPPQMTPPPCPSEAEYVARKPLTPVTSAASEGFALNQPPTTNFTHDLQTVMNTQAQTIIFGETYALQQGNSRGCFSGKSDADMKKQNSDACHFLSTASPTKYPYMIVRFEVERHDYIALVKDNIYTFHELSIPPPNETARESATRVAIKYAIGINIQRQLNAWKVLI